MSISVGQSSSVTAQSSASAEFLTAAVAKSQQELEGQMALQLIQSAGPVAAAAAPTGNIGQHINIKV
ncbi:hypothetical protein [Colwellia sp. E2M01]|uniref:hypothetical protein n=1 Tax=Colwellia sp. E2M01 TaxID=2841561 RepID=UPI001C08CCDD|nr:hypothetical protein [Colwellia sp. E2M01]MBU2871467.1 hypothetical protein [Colwellia sp. E2M01]